MNECVSRLSALNPFKRIPTIMTAEEILKFAHNKSLRLSVKSSKMISKNERTRLREIARFQEFSNEVKGKSA